MTAPQRVATVSQGSTCSPSTFCQPLGSSPPRLARAPMYWSRSLNDSDIVRAPDFTDSVPPGDTAAIATTCSVPRLALGLSDRKSTRLNSVTNAHIVCRLLLEK